MLTTENVIPAVGETRIIEVDVPVIIAGRPCAVGDQVECPAYDAQVVVGMKRAHYVDEDETETDETTAETPVSPKPRTKKPKAQ